MGVRYVLEGGVRKAGGRVCVMLQLIEADTGRHIRARRFDRDLAGIGRFVTTFVNPFVNTDRFIERPPLSCVPGGGTAK